MGTLLPGCIDLTGQANGPAYRDRTLTAILPSEVAPANRSVEEYYFVLVSGGDRAEHVRSLIAASPQAAPLPYDWSAVRSELRPAAP